MKTQSPQTKEALPTHPYILVGTDLGKRTESCYPILRDLCISMESAVHFLHVFTPTPAPSRDAAREAQRLLGKSQALHDAERSLEIAANWFDADQLDVSWSINQVGPPARALLDLARERRPQLIVLATDKRESLADRLTGTITSAVLAEAPCAVLTLTPEQGKRGLDWQRVLLPVDFSEDSAITTESALPFIKPGSVIDLQYIVPDSFPVYHGARGLQSDYYDFDQLDAGFGEDVARFWQRFGREDLELEAHRRQGDTEEVISRATTKRDIDLLVMPVRKTGWFRDLGARLANRPENCAILSVPLPDYETTDVRAPAELLKSVGR
jgi:nucleotide-binding universal stress UspA family protein